MARIMVIDDDDGVRRVLRRTLERAGHAVTEEPDGHSALRHFAGDPADIVISDVFMPDMDGIQLLMRIREAFPEAKIIVISGGGQLGAENVLTAAKTLGAAEVLQKPFELTELTSLVDSLLEG